MMKKKILASVVLAALAAGAALPAHAIRVSENETGQVLLGTQYLLTTIPGTNEQYTKNTIRVVNTNLTNAVKAKLVLRSQRFSLECFDTILYLTPGDVAVLDLSSTSVLGRPMLKVSSTDDSILSSRSADNRTLTFASQSGFQLGFNDTTNPARDGIIVNEDNLSTFTGAGVNSTLTSAAGAALPSGDTCLQGHIEVVGAYAVGGDRNPATADVISASGGVSIDQQMSKFNLIRVFDTPKATLNTLNASNRSVTNNNLAITDRTARVNDYSDRVQINGIVDIIKEDDRISAPMVALREGINYLTAGISTPVISNPTFDASPVAESGIGSGFSDGLGSDLVTLTRVGNTRTNDNVPDIEAAITETSLAGFYDNTATNKVLAAVAFPTKYRHRATGVPFGTTTWGAPFVNDVWGSVFWTSTIFDEQENSKIATPGLVCVVSPCPITIATARALNFEVNFTSIATDANDFVLNNAAGTPLPASTRGWFSYNINGTTAGLTGITGNVWNYSSNSSFRTSGHDTYFASNITGTEVPAIGYVHNFVLVNNKVSRSVTQTFFRGNTVNAN